MNPFSIRYSVSAGSWHINLSPKKLKKGLNDIALEYDSECEQGYGLKGEYYRSNTHTIVTMIHWLLPTAGRSLVISKRYACYLNVDVAFMPHSLGYHTKCTCAAVVLLSLLFPVAPSGYTGLRVISALSILCEAAIVTFMGSTSR